MGKKRYTKLKRVLIRQAVITVITLAGINWITGVAVIRGNPLRFLSCSWLNARIEALTYLGLYWATHFYRLPDRQDYHRYIEQAAETYQVDKYLIYALIEVESTYRYYAVSPTGACGLMQLLPRTSRALKLANPFNPEDNIMAGTGYLKKLTDRFRGDIWMALAAYNWGPTRISRRGNEFSPEMEKYIMKILKARFRYSSRNRPATLWD